MKGDVRVIRPYKERTINIGDPVIVYRNLNNGMFSIRCARANLVLAHGNSFIVQGSPKVSEASRLRVIKEKRKSVHAFILGIFQEEDAEKYPYSIVDEAYYNPYTTDSFIYKKNNKKVTHGDFLFKDGKAYVINSLVLKTS